MMLKYTRFFEAKEDYSFFKKGERCELIETNIAYPHELSTCTVLLGNRITVEMFLLEFKKHFKPIKGEEEMNFNDVLEKAIKEQGLQEELDSIAKRLGELELEKQELLKRAEELKNADV